ncbi:homocysteine S-methyltransferase family protein [Neptunicoccus cionae]|uniref:Homocysteine S-methyltransferase n=1 Tax=Neptunicoccus cionae TaxID=2035344 RepID=A0A916VT88_9RHOB|nr:homocysteine S-methyltransferase family protein [Amylibacter cionae]GGA30270.1 homocysteine S-methyltransferase [Amylibacter cionae]
MTITILDGGMGQELLRRSAHPAHPMWSAKVLMDEPEIVQGLHEDFIRSGAQVITLNSYSATPERLTRDGKPDWFEPLQKRAIALAKAARDGIDPSVKIAGCLPPLRASYRPDLSPDFEDNLRRYQEIVAVQKDHVDLIQCETMSSIAEATAACTAAVETGLPVWLGLSVADDASNTLRSGEPLEQALDAVEGLGAAAILLNCSIPEAISAALPLVAQRGVRFGAYANGFTSISALQPGGTVDGLQARTDLGPAAYADFAAEWVSLGATIIGGCCEVGPDHIAELSRRFAG